MADTAELGGCRTSSINNRRYLGNKYKLLPFITGVVERECRGIRTVADIFSGTGAVASAFQDRRLITNDLMYSNYICNFAWFGAQPYDQEKVVELVAGYNAAQTDEENYMTENFSDTYFSRADCARIGFIREDIERRCRRNELNFRERAILITSLLYAMDKIALTCGHYDAYRRGAVSGQPLELRVPLAPTDNDPGNQCFNEDANNLVKRISADLVYIDPPYNSRQYCDTYHLLEKLAIAPENVAYVGDDLIDWPVMEKVGLSVAVADAHPLLIPRADYVTRIAGGRGAVREVCDLLLLAQGKLDEAKGQSI